MDFSLVHHIGPVIITFSEVVKVQYSKLGIRRKILQYIFANMYIGMAARVRSVMALLSLADDERIEPALLTSPLELRLAGLSIVVNCRV